MPATVTLGQAELDAVAAVFDIPADEILSRTRREPVRIARQTLIWVLRHRGFSILDCCAITSLSPPSIYYAVDESEYRARARPGSSYVAKVTDVMRRLKTT